MDLSSDKKTIYTGGSDGTVTAWDPESGNNQRIGGSGHGAQIIQIKGIKLIKLISNLKSVFWSSKQSLHHIALGINPCIK